MKKCCIEHVEHVEVPYKYCALHRIHTAGDKNNVTQSHCPWSNYLLCSHLLDLQGLMRCSPGGTINKQKSPAPIPPPALPFLCPFILYALAAHLFFPFSPVGHRQRCVNTSRPHSGAPLVPR
jgi:hypothetical protein